MKNDDMFQIDTENVNANVIIIFLRCNSMCFGINYLTISSNYHIMYTNVPFIGRLIDYTESSLINYHP